MKPFPLVPKRDRPREISIQGIPDPWLEYLVLEDVNKSSGSNGQCRFRCNSFDVTQSLWRDYGISLEQGIPNYKISVMKSLIERNDVKKRENDTQKCLKDSSCQSDEPIIEGKNKKTSNDKKMKKKSLTGENFSKNVNENALIIDENINWLKNLSINDIMNGKYLKRESSRKESKIVKVMKGIFRRWKRNSKRISNDLSKFDDNFICYHCNCPYFKVCKFCKCSGVEKSLGKLSKPRKSDNSEKFKNKKTLEKSFDSKNSKKFNGNPQIKGNEQFDEDISTSRAFPIIEMNEIHSGSSKSALLELHVKKNEEKNEKITINSRNSLKLKSSSERMKKLVHDCFPREFGVCDGKILTGNQVLKSMETSENDNSSLQTEFAEIQKFESNFMRKTDEIYGEEGKKRGPINTVKENGWLFAVRNFGGLGALQESEKREFDFEELQKDSGLKNSESVKILYEGLSKRKETLNNLQIDHFIVENSSEN